MTIYRPELIILEINCFEFQESPMRLLEEDTRYFPFEDYVALLYNSHDRQKAIFNRYYLFQHKSSVEGAMDLSYHGFTPYVGKAEKLVVIDDKDLEIKSEMLHYFKLLLESFKRDNLKVVLVMMPIRIDDDFQDGATFDSIYATATGAGIELLDYRNYFQSDSVFFDWGHLNMNGSEIISAKILQDVESSFQQL